MKRPEQYFKPSAAFIERHPYELTDGRRFASIRAAAEAVVNADYPVAGFSGPDGHYSHDDCTAIWRETNRDR